ncbi:hypothetical protein B0H13DRAFT_1895252 [Mycena leptocephala]|nr:hypothetical protein B0H13DRAFT_1895252 [Mycena leptocephala]
MGSRVSYILQWTEGNKIITVEFGKVLRAIQERLVNYLTIFSSPPVGFSGIEATVGAVCSPAQGHRLEELENMKKPHALYAAALGSATPLPSRTPPTPKPKPPPLPSPVDERLLVRFDGDTPSILAAPYPEILRLVNAHLHSLSLPGLLYAQRQNSSSLFIVPASKADVDILAKEWSRWSPGIFPGARIAPIAVHSHLQVDGILFSDVGDMKDLKREFEAKNPDLGKVVGLPTWVNRPPSESQIAAMVAGVPLLPSGV